MSDQRDEYGNPVGSTIDEYGNPIGYDEFGNQIRRGVYGSSIDRIDDPTGVTAGGTDTGGLQYPGVTDVGIGGGHGGHVQQEHRVVGVTTIRRSKSYSRSTSSSSSEDDGQRGRRKKKGLKEKIKETLPGGHKHWHEQTAGYGATGYAGHDQTRHEKKGMMEKIKDKVLPGHRKDEGPA